MNLPAAAVDLVKAFEGRRLSTYTCPGGVPTIGWGHTSSAGPPKVRDGMTITVDEAERILVADLTDVAARLRPLIDVALTDNQFGALVSFAFNCGLGAFERSTLRKLVNAGDFAAVPAELAKWKRAGGKVLPGLARRRAAEGELWRS